MYSWRIAFAFLFLSALAGAATTIFSDAATTLIVDASTISPQVYGASTQFSCTYADTLGSQIELSSCSLVIDGRSSKTVPLGPYFVYGEVLSVGTHAWYCSCSAPGYRSAESAPRQMVVLPPQSASILKSDAEAAVIHAELQLQKAKLSGADTVDAEKQLEAAKTALNAGDYRLANALASGGMFSNALESRDSLSDMGLLLVFTLFFGVIIVVALFLLLRK